MPHTPASELQPGVQFSTLRDSGCFVISAPNDFGIFEAWVRQHRVHLSVCMVERIDPTKLDDDSDHPVIEAMWARVNELPDTGEGGPFHLASEQAREIADDYRRATSSDERERDDVVDEYEEDEHGCPRTPQWIAGACLRDATRVAAATELREVESGGTLRYDDEGRPIVDVVTCGHCGSSWNDAIVTGVTPAPSGRCPFEHEHVYPED